MTGKVLVTGAAGFIGRATVHALSEAGWQVRAATRDPSKIEASERVEPVAMGDLGDEIDWAPLLDGVSHVVHLAGLAHAPGVLDEETYMRINAAPVGKLADAAKGRVERIVFISTTRTQAGLSIDEPVNEALSPQPTDSYGRSKLEGERLLIESGVPYTILRPTVIYGPHMKGNLASLATMAKTPMPLPFQALTNKRSLLGLDSLVSAILLTLTSEAALNETFVVADTEPVTVGEMIAAIRAGLGRKPNLVSIPEGALRRVLHSFGRGGDWDRISGNFVVDSAKLRGIGWEPATSSTEGIEAAIRTEGALTTL
ncbi:NAD-dependent epimerase/dehydratase family protein [Methyloligella sp. 2.7D]